MADKPIKTFREDWFRRFQKHLFIIVFIPGGLFVQKSLIGQIQFEYNRSDYFSIIFWSILFLGMFWLEYISIIYMQTIKTAAATVDVYEDRIVGHAQYKKNIWVLKYVDIKKIYPKPGAVRPYFVFEDKNGDKYNISILMDYLKECMEYIQYQSVNLEVYKLGTVPKNDIEWKKSDDPII